MELTFWLSYPNQWTVGDPNKVLGLILSHESQDNYTTFYLQFQPFLE